MSSSHSILATVQCNVDRQSIERIVAPFGLRTTQGSQVDKFFIVAARHSEPEVNVELAHMALTSLSTAQELGAIPSVAIMSSKIPRVS
jgi:hypothetical protein